jgi:aspartyl-tRNA(Asn)/glutamyl-tRNA(Gln) amidotransferase subunit C
LIITIDDLKNTAALASLNLDEDKLAAVFPAFEQMLGYFNAIQAADSDLAAFPEGLDVTDAHNSPAVGSAFFRPAINDVLSNNDNLMSNAAQRDGRFIAIPLVR